MCESIFDIKNGINSFNFNKVAQKFMDILCATTRNHLKSIFSKVMRLSLFFYYILVHFSMHTQYIYNRQGYHKMWHVFISTTYDYWK